MLLVSVEVRSAIIEAMRTEEYKKMQKVELRADGWSARYSNRILAIRTCLHSLIYSSERREREEERAASYYYDYYCYHARTHPNPLFSFT